jgi:hypothetical protein
MKLKFRDLQDLHDLSSYLTRAKRMDESGLVKLKSFGDVLAVYVSPIFSGNLLDDGPTVIGLRTVAISADSSVDLAFEISALLERIAGVGEDLELSLPPVASRAAWTGVTPPRTDWELVESLQQAELTKWAKNGIAEVASSLPDSIGVAIANKVRSQIWGKKVGVTQLFPAGCAFGLVGLGFLSPGETVKLYRTKGWVRLETKYGHVMAKA